MNIKIGDKVYILPDDDRPVTIHNYPEPPLIGDGMTFYVFRVKFSFKEEDWKQSIVKEYHVCADSEEEARQLVKQAALTEKFGVWTI